MNDDAYRRVIQALREHGYKVTESGNSASAQCPAHEDRIASMTVSRGERQAVVLHCHRGVPCPPEDILAKLGLTWADVSNPAEQQWMDGDRWMPCGHIKVAEYQYRNEHRELVFAVARCSEKGRTCQGFRQWRPDPHARSGKKWTRKLPDGTRVGDGLIYRLPDVLAARIVVAWPEDSDETIDVSRNVWIVEGEKDVDRLWSMGVPATCNAEGAGKWTGAHADWLAGRDIIIVADLDQAGWQHMGHVVDTLLDKARSIEVVKAHTGKDISDHLAAGKLLRDVVTIDAPKPWPKKIGSGGEDLA